MERVQRDEDNPWPMSCLQELLPPNPTVFHPQSDMLSTRRISLARFTYQDDTGPIELLPKSEERFKKGSGDVRMCPARMGFKRGGITGMAPVHAAGSPYNSSRCMNVSLF